MNRITKFWGAPILGALLFGNAACYQKPAAPPETRKADNRAAEENAIRLQALEWAKDLSAKDLEKTLSFYAPDAFVFPPNQPVAATADQRRKVWADTFAIPGVALETASSRIEAAKSGDIGYETGTFQLSAKDKKGKATTTIGKYVVVWKKQSDGSWKAAADIWNADQ